MLMDAPNWTYRDLLSCTLAEVEHQTSRAVNADLRDEARAKAWGAVGLWLRLTDESRCPEDLKLLMAKVNVILNSTR